eukprot:4949927-Pyramimonas_sp.AAC.1
MRAPDRVWEPIRDSLSYEVGRAYVLSVSGAFSAWIAAVGAVHHERAGTVDGGAPSRADGPIMRIERAHHSQHHRDMPFRDVIANWWERVHVIMSKMSRHGRRGNGAAQIRELAQAGSGLGSQAPDGVQKLVGAGPEATS